jgi:hypothetical protein
MNKPVLKILMTMALCALSTAAFAKKDCEELKSEIDAKIKQNGVNTFTLEVLPADAPTEGKVVGMCESGAKKIVYKRG